MLLILLMLHACYVGNVTKVTGKLRYQSLVGRALGGYLQPSGALVFVSKDLSQEFSQKNLEIVATFP